MNQFQVYPGSFCRSVIGQPKGCSVGTARHGFGSRCGYTLVELIVVVIIMAILSATAIPVLNQSTQARQGASRDEVVRFFEFARGRAISSGVPTGVSVDTNDSTLTVITLDGSGDVVNVIDPINGGQMTVDISELFAGVETSSFVNGNGSGGDGAAWFDYRAEPHLRNLNTGAFTAEFTQNATVTLSTGSLIVVHAGSGFVEVK